HPLPTVPSTLSLHDALPISDGDWLPPVRQRLCRRYPAMHRGFGRGGYGALYAITPDWHPIVDRCPGIDGLFCAVGFSGHGFKMRSEEHTSELQSRFDLVCRL